MSSVSSTPLMQQYREIKSRHRDAILLFRMGDFYEMFYEDAETASRVLGLTLTARNNGGAAEVPLAGVPAKAMAEYLRKLVKQGFKVAICEQVEDPKLAKGIVRREVVETITPGAAFADDLLEVHRNNFLCALVKLPDRGSRDGSVITGLAAADLSTGEFRLAQVSDAAALDALIARFAPRELLLARGSDAPVKVDGALVTEREAWEFDPAMAREELTRHFRVLSLSGFGIESEHDAAAAAAGALVRYLRELQPSGLPQLAPPILERERGTMPLDEMTRRNLELVESLRPEPDSSGPAAGTLLAVLDRTVTPMGARLMRQWLLAPLVQRDAINARLHAVEQLVKGAMDRRSLREALDGVRDIERLGSKAAAGRATPRDLRALGDSLGRLPLVGEVLERVRKDEAVSDAAAGPAEGTDPDRLTIILAGWDSCTELSEDISGVLVDRPPLQVGEEETIRAGFDAELDELRELRAGGKDGIARIQQEERERTGIAALKVGYNRVFGYYIEVSNANRHLVPDDYQRRQTLTGAERYVTAALKEYEERVMSASERIEKRERELVDALRIRAGSQIRRLQAIAARVAELDVLAAFAEVAERESYVRPQIMDGFELDITGGRHPVVERMMARDAFIPNDVRLTNDARVIILTGPNMAGKSTVLRQVGLIVLMAQVGCFVPASRASIGLVDRLFTRVGASDNLVRGQSTFMVEMSETSAILHGATDRSLVLLDEIGRGTSTYDGVSIAWAVSEHLHEKLRCKTIFATHYHELVQLADELPAVRNFTVDVRESGDTIVFLHRLRPGGADRSYGIEVGRLAGLPESVLSRAREVLHLLESEQLARDLATDAVSGGASGGNGDRGGDTAGNVGEFALAPGGGGDQKRVVRRHLPAPRAMDDQLGLFGTAHPVIERLRKVDPDAMTPREALALLAEIVDQLG
ncbi:MAG TPA: DNA mismatch repair protein MutS [Gemmatimonadales bacterium]|nr:DNA mismatch repair protein MutS [Gemmatimonadales bacterium]